MVSSVIAIYMGFLQGLCYSPIFLTDQVLCFVLVVTCVTHHVGIMWGRSFCFRPHVYLCVGHGAVLAGVSPVIESWITYPLTVNVIKRENVSGKEVIITGKIQRADRSPYQQFHRKIQTGAGPGDEKLLLRY